MTGRADIPIVLCCAEDDEPPLAKVVDQLHREGMAPELVTGVELDAATFSASVDEARGPALYVICQSASLDRATARRLTGLFSARRGAGQVEARGRAPRGDLTPRLDSAPAPGLPGSGTPD